MSGVPSALTGMDQVALRIGILEGKIDAGMARFVEHMTDDARSFAALRAEFRDSVATAARDTAERHAQMTAAHTAAIARVEARMERIEAAAQEIAFVRRQLCGEAGEPGLIAEVRDLVQLATRGRGLLRVLTWLGGSCGLAAMANEVIRLWHVVGPK